MLIYITLLSSLQQSCNVVKYYYLPILQMGKTEAEREQLARIHQNPDGKAKVKFKFKAQSPNHYAIPAPPTPTSCFLLA